MCAICGNQEHPDPKMVEENIRKLREEVDAVVSGGQDFYVMSVGPGEITPPFSYSIGLVQDGLPDLVMGGVPPSLAYRYLHDIQAWMKTHPLDEEALVSNEGFVLPKEATPHTADGYYLRMIRLAKGDEFAWCSQCYERLGLEGRGFVQVLWPSKDMLFPYEAGCDAETIYYQMVEEPVNMSAFAGATRAINPDAKTVH